MNRVRREPAAIAGAIGVLINAAMMLSNAMAWYAFTPAQMAAINAFYVALASVIVRQNVYAPIDADGDEVTVVKASGA